MIVRLPPNRTGPKWILERLAGRSWGIALGTPSALTPPLAKLQTVTTGAERAPAHKRSNCETERVSANALRSKTVEGDADFFWRLLHRRGEHDSVSPLLEGPTVGLPYRLEKL